MKLLAFLLILLTANITLCAQNIGDAVDADKLLVGHLRYCAKSGTTFGYRLLTADSITHYIQLKSQGNDNFDTFCFHRVKLSFGKFDRDGKALQDSVIAIPLASVASGKDAALSLKLTPAGNLAIISVGGDEIEYESSLPYCNITRVEPFCNQKAREIYTHHVFKAKKHATESFAYNPESLKEQLLNSADPVEGFWQHYEQDSSNLKSSSDRQYTLGCVATDRGYDLFIISAKGLPPMQEPGKIKGVLTPSGMAGVYDVIWTDVHGKSFAGGTSAIFSDNLLTIVFPRWDTSVRYVKLKQAPY